MIQHKDNKIKVNKNKGCTIYRNLSTLDDVDAVQGLHFPGGWYGDTQKGSNRVMCRTAGDASMYHKIWVQSRCRY